MNVNSCAKGAMRPDPCPAKTTLSSISCWSASRDMQKLLQRSAGMTPWQARAPSLMMVQICSKCATDDGAFMRVLVSRCSARVLSVHLLDARGLADGREGSAEEVFKILGARFVFGCGGFDGLLCRGSAVAEVDEGGEDIVGSGAGGFTLGAVSFGDGFSATSSCASFGGSELMFRVADSSRTRALRQARDWARSYPLSRYFSAGFSGEARRSVRFAATVGEAVGVDVDSVTILQGTSDRIEVHERAFYELNWKAGEGLLHTLSIRVTRKDTDRVGVWSLEKCLHYGKALSASAADDEDAFLGSV